MGRRSRMRGGPLSEVEERAGDYAAPDDGPPAAAIPQSLPAKVADFAEQVRNTVDPPSRTRKPDSSATAELGSATAAPEPVEPKSLDGTALDRARDLDSAVASELWPEPSPPGDLAARVAEAGQRRQSVRRRLEEALQEFDSRQQDSLQQLMSRVASSLKKVGGDSLSEAYKQRTPVGGTPRWGSGSPRPRSSPRCKESPRREQTFSTREPTSSSTRELSMRSCPPPQSARSASVQSARKTKANKIVDPVNFQASAPPMDDGLRSISKPPIAPLVFDRVPCAPPPEPSAGATRSPESSTFVAARQDARLLKEIQAVMEAGMKRVMDMQEETVSLLKSKAIQESAIVAGGDRIELEETVHSMDSIDDSAAVAAESSKRENGAEVKASPPSKADGPPAIRRRQSMRDSMVTWKNRLGFHKSALSRMLIKRVDPYLPRCLKPTVSMFAEVFDTIYDLKEPPRTGCLADMVKSSFFELACVLVIFANVAFTIIAVNTDLDSIKEGNYTQTNSSLVVDTVFLGLYSIELTMRLLVHGRYFFVNDEARWNIFDLSLVLLTGLDVVTGWVEAGDENAQSNSKSHVRMLRLLKFGRIARALKAVRFFEQLRLMLELCMTSVSCVFWAMVMICLVLFMASLLFVEGVVSHVKGMESPEQELAKLSQFDGLFTAGITCLQAATGGVDWMDPYETLATLGPMYQSLFVLYVLFFILILLNIVTSVFLDRVMKFAEPSIDSVIEEKMWLEERDLRQLEEVLAKVDGDRTGSIDADEFRHLVANQNFGALLAARGIDINEAAVFFNLIAETSGRDSIDIKDMVRSCLRMKGTASQIDLQIIRHEMKVEYKRLSTSIRQLTERQGRGTPPPRPLKP